MLSLSTCRLFFNSRGMNGMQQPKPAIAMNCESERTMRFFFQDEYLSIFSVISYVDVKSFAEFFCAASWPRIRRRECHKAFKCAIPLCAWKSNVLMRGHWPRRTTAQIEIFLYLVCKNAKAH